MYYLRTLLLHVSRAKRFEDICRGEGELFLTFREACEKRGLLADDGLWKRTLRESFRLSCVPLLENVCCYSSDLQSVGSSYAMGSAWISVCFGHSGTQAGQQSTSRCEGC